MNTIRKSACQAFEEYVIKSLEEGKNIRDLTFKGFEQYSGILMREATFRQYVIGVIAGYRTGPRIPSEVRTKYAHLLQGLAQYRRSKRAPVEPRNRAAELDKAKEFLIHNPQYSRVAMNVLMSTKLTPKEFRETRYRIAREKATAAMVLPTAPKVERVKTFEIDAPRPIQFFEIVDGTILDTGHMLLLDKILKEVSARSGRTYSVSLTTYPKKGVELRVV